VDVNRRRIELNGAIAWPFTRPVYNTRVLTFSLQSGSNGNCIYVEAGGKRLLFDAGINGACAAKRLGAYGRSIRDVDAVIISHEHADHIRFAGVYNRQFRIPVYMTRSTMIMSWCDLGKLRDVRYFYSGDPLSFGPVTVYTVPTAHDAVDGVAFVVECEGKRLGILTDLGHPFSGLQAVLESLDAAYLECNYDPELLANGTYSPALKARIAGRGGHLSNVESAELLRACGKKRPKWLAVAHLSEENNRPALAFEAQHRAIGHDYPVRLAPRYGPSEILVV